MTRRPNSGGGFTLIEMIALIALVAILAAVAIPSLSSIHDTRTSSACSQLHRDTSFARQYAVGTGVNTWLVIDPILDRWEILAEDPMNPGRAGATLLIDPMTGDGYDVTVGAEYPGVDLTFVDFDGGRELGFDWLGKPLSDAETPLQSEGVVRFDPGHEVRVAPETGMVVRAVP